jgi:NAD(P)-dependent dehydrogenase (short-subunit alcohol dehydrogenase family)
MIGQTRHPSGRAARSEDAVRLHLRSDLPGPGQRRRSGAPALHHAGRRRTTDPQLYERVRREIPFGRMGAPEDIANVILFLASLYAGWVPGQIIVVDGEQILGA